ncbi:MAG: hypothetical protein JXQ66_03055 [Campylobacterales bacterium]|nr:hypothetical protein [Campylobacterales bacterium]
MFTLKDSKSIIKREYGKNLSALMVVDSNENVQEYVDFFTTLFKNIFICENYDSGEYFWQHATKKYDLVIVHINKEKNRANDLISRIREENEHIYSCF